MFSIIRNAVEFSQVTGMNARNRVTPENIQVQTSALNSIISQFRVNVGEQLFQEHMRTLLSLHNIAPMLDMSAVTPVHTAVAAVVAPPTTQQTSGINSETNDGVALNFIDGNMSSIGTAIVAVSQDPATFLAAIVNSIPEDIRQRVARVWVSQAGKLVATYNYDRINHTIARA